MDRFGHSQSWLLIVFNDIFIHIYRRFKQILEWDNKRLIFVKLSEYILAIYAMEGGYCFWGFIDKTLNTTCCPFVNQHEFYSGHKRKHRYIYQSIVTLDG